MRFKWVKQLSLVVVIAMLVSALPVYAATSNDKSEVVFHFVSEQDDASLSTAHTFFSKYTAYAYEEDGQKYFEIPVPKQYSLKLTIEKDAGEILLETDTYTSYKYKVSAFETALDAVTTYNIGNGESSHSVKLIIGNDIDAVKTELVAELEKAANVENQTDRLAAAITAAKAANTYVALKSEIEDTLSELRAAIAEAEAGQATATPAPSSSSAPEVTPEPTASTQPEQSAKPEESATPSPTPTPEMSTTPVTVSYVKADDYKVSYDQHFSRLVENASTYTKDRKTYLRLQYKNTASLKIVVAGNEGALVDEIKQNEEVVSFVYDYAIASKTAPIAASASYSIPSGTHTYEMVLVLDQDATDEDRLALAAKIDEASAVSSPSGALRQAIAAAISDHHFVSRKAVLVAHISKLEKEIANNEQMSETIENVELSFYKEDKMTGNFTSVSKYYTDAKVYEVSGKLFLRITQQNTANLVTTLNGVKGMLVQELFLNETKPDVASHYIFDYEISSTEKALLWNVSYTAGSYSGSHNAYVVINQDATDEDRSALAEAIQTAKRVGTKDDALVTAITLAEASNNNVSKKSELSAHVERLNELIAKNEKTIATLKPATVDYVKSTELNTSFNSSFASFLTEPKTYEAAGKHYLRIKVTTNYDLKFTVEGKAGELVAYVGEPGSYSHIIYDYELSSVTKPVLSEVQYNAGAFIGQHEQYVVLNQDATDEDRKALGDAIAKAELINQKGTALTKALNDAKAVQNLLSRKAVLNEATSALNKAIAANGTSSGNSPNPTDINEESGLEVGRYMVSVTALKNNSNETSIMNGYIDGDARLNVTKNKLMVYVAMNNASMIKSLTVEGKKASVTNTYKGSDVVRFGFEVSTLKGTIDASIHVIATENGEVLYDTTHSIQFSFGEPSKVDAWEDEGYSKGDSSTPATDTEQSEEETVDPSTENEPSEGQTGTTEKPEIPQFKDIADSWAKAAIERAVSLKLVNGYTDGTFKPNQTINRAEFTAIIARALKLEAPKGELSFVDASDIQGWAKDAIQGAVEAGIVTGFADHTFRPSANITRVEMAVMLVKGLGLEQEEAAALSFKDANDVPAWAKKYVVIAVKHGLIQGNTDGTFKPNQAATRAEAIAIALRALDFSK